MQTRAGRRWDRRGERVVSTGKGTFRQERFNGFERSVRFQVDYLTYLLRARTSVFVRDEIADRGERRPQAIRALAEKCLTSPANIHRWLNFL